jgi:LPXTG-motif cell wall-anchored protein
MMDSAQHEVHRQARRAVGLAAGVVVALAASHMIYGMTWATTGRNRLADTGVETMNAIAYLGGLLASLVAFVLAIVARVKHESWTLLWLPLSLFPTLVAIMALAIPTA